MSASFDRAGRVTSDGRSLTGITGDAGTGTQAFTYDNLSRLTGSTGLAVSSSYQYDLDGNRTQKVEGSTTTAYTYDRADQLATQTVTGLPLRTFDYDAYGNLLSAWDATNAQTTYAYDEASRLTTIAPPGGAGTQVTFTFDALDRNNTRSVGGTLADTYGYLDSTETAYQVGTASTTGSLLDAEGTRLAVKTGSTVSWLLFDLHGSVAAMCPAGSTTLSDAYRYDGFGQQIANAGTVTNPWRYRGLLNLTSDFGSGALLSMGARDYAPQLEVFTQEDSVQGSAANPMTMNRFLYALANPATLIDPDGHMVPSASDDPYYPAPPKPGNVLCNSNDDCHGGGTANSDAPGTIAFEIEMKKSEDALAAGSPSGTTYHWVSDVLLDQDNAIVDPTLFRGLDGTCGLAPRPDGILAGGPCTWYWNTVDKLNAEMAAWCRSDPEACKKYAGDKLLAIASIVVLTAGAGGCVAYCTRILQAGKIFLANQAYNLRDKVVGFWGPVKPIVSDPKLQVWVDYLYRAKAVIGNGGTADAVRAGQGHIQKASDAITGLWRWMAEHPDASAADKDAAETMIMDLIYALANKGFPK